MLHIVTFLRDFLVNPKHSLQNYKKILKKCFLSTTTNMISVIAWSFQQHNSLLFVTKGVKILLRWERLYDTLHNDWNRDAFWWRCNDVISQILIQHTRIVTAVVYLYETHEHTHMYIYIYMVCVMVNFCLFKYWRIFVESLNPLITGRCFT